ncbi:putative nuclease HARBI1 [Eublepharis macularius]|uniref:Nuclease HARBI1 n=1 Tax=Eublepharis macularius TaxID=481883 RepID=A0AA97JUI1_EUBMA|nr:putative nuclease HARBI1 [Eublepharis macularius]
MSAVRALALALLHIIFIYIQRSIDACNSYWMRVVRRRRMLRKSLALRCIPPPLWRTRRTAMNRARFLAVAGIRVPRRYWIYPRSRDWWDNFVTAIWDDQLWIENFRMTRETFNELVHSIGHRLSRQRTRLRNPISVEMRVAIALWYLANCSTYRQCMNQFGVGISTVAGIVLEVCLAIELELLSRVVCLGPDVARIMSGFQKLGFPHCIGAVDGTHVAICKFKGRGREYINRKKFNSILIQGTVDHTGRFIDAEVGWSGRNHDAFVFVNSAICTAMDAGVFVPGNPSLTIEGVTVPPLIISDAAYPMRRWLMKPFNRPHTPAEAYFDRCLTRARTIVERCFGRLKGRWRCLRSQLMVAEENVTCIATACVVLHNICELKGHGIPEDDSPVRPVEVDEESLELPVGDRRHREEGKLVCDALARHMFRNREI